MFAQIARVSTASVGFLAVVDEGNTAEDGDREKRRSDSSEGGKKGKEEVR